MFLWGHLKPVDADVFCAESCHNSLDRAEGGEGVAFFSTEVSEFLICICTSLVGLLTCLEVQAVHQSLKNLDCIEAFPSSVFPN